MKKLLLTNSRNMKEHEEHTPKLAMSYTNLFLIAGLFLLTTIASAQVRWTADVSKNYKQSFAAFDTHGDQNSGSCGDFNHDEPTVSTVNDATYGKVWKIRKKKGRKRAELARPLIKKSKNQVIPANRPYPFLGNNDYAIPKDGELVYYAWRWKITSTTTINDSFAVWQWKSSGKSSTWTQNYPLSMSYDGKKLKLIATGPDYPTWNANDINIKKRQSTIWEQDVKTNKWVHIIIGIKISKDPKKGYVEFWFDGKKQILKNSTLSYGTYKVKLSSDKKRAYHKTYDGEEIHPKWGVYGGTACGYDASAYYSDLKMAASFNDVNPGSSGTGGGGGNTGGNTGNTGGPSGYTFAANEKGTVNVSGTVHIAYGANGKFEYKYNVTSNTPCTNAIFGDPIKGVTKRCYIKTVSTGSTGGSQLAGTYYFQNVATGHYMDSDGTRVKMGAPNTNKDRQWRLVATANGYYNIDSNFNGRGVLDTDGGNTVNGTTVQPGANDSSRDDRVWQSEQVSGNIYRFKNKTSGRDYLAQKHNSIEIEYTTWNGPRAQWRLIKVGAAKAAAIDAVSEIKLFPNPATSSFTIDTGNESPSTMQVFNISGQMVLERVISNVTTIQTDTLGAGIYLVRVLNEDGSSLNSKLILR